MTTTTINSVTTRIKPTIRNKEQLLLRMDSLKKEKKNLELEFSKNFNEGLEMLNPKNLLNVVVDTLSTSSDGGVVQKTSSGLLGFLLTNAVAYTKFGFFKKIALQTIAPYASNAIINFVKNKIAKHKKVTAE